MITAYELDTVSCAFASLLLQTVDCICFDVILLVKLVFFSMCYLLCFKPKEINWLYIIHFNTVHEYIKLHITGHIIVKNNRFAFTTSVIH